MIRNIESTMIRRMNFKFFYAAVVLFLLVMVSCSFPRPTDPIQAAKYDSMMLKKEQYGKGSGNVYRNVNVYDGDVQVQVFSSYALIDTRNWKDLQFELFNDGVYSEQKIKNLYQTFFDNAIRPKLSFTDKLRLKKGEKGNILDDTPNLLNILIQETMRLYDNRKVDLQEGNLNFIGLQVGEGTFWMTPDLFHGKEVLAISHLNFAGEVIGLYMFDTKGEGIIKVLNHKKANYRAGYRY